jgi:YidC/Oxa1 family membrane protein insertase
MDDQNKNLLMATGLSFAVMLAWFAIAPPQTAPPPEQAQSETAPVAATAPGTAEVSTNMGTGSVQAVATAKRITISTPAPRRLPITSRRTH